MRHATLENGFWFKRLSLAFLFIFGCNPLSPLGGSDDITSDQRVITAEGGGLSIAGARVTFPPEAVSEPVTVTLKRINNPAPLPEILNSPLTHFISITPADLELEEAVVVELDLNDLDDFVLLGQPGDLCAWSILSTGLLARDQTVSGKTVIFSVKFLGSFTAALLLEEDALCVEDLNCGTTTDFCFEVEGVTECFDDIPNICRTDGSCTTWEACACAQRRECWFEFWSSFSCRIPADPDSEACLSFITGIAERDLEGFEEE